MTPDFSGNSVWLVSSPAEKFVQSTLYLADSSHECNSLTGIVSSTVSLRVHSHKFSSNFLLFCNVLCLPVGLYIFQGYLHRTSINFLFFCSKVRHVHLNHWQTFKMYLFCCHYNFVVSFFFFFVNSNYYYLLIYLFYIFLFVYKVKINCK